MESVIFSEISYGQAPPLPKLRTVQECNRRDSLSSSRTQDSGYISDPELSLSPLDFVCSNVPHTSSDFIYDSSALFDVKEIACRIKRCADTPLNPVQAKKNKIAQDIASIPKIEVTSNPTTADETSVDIHCDPLATDFKHPARKLTPNDTIEPWTPNDLHLSDQPKERNLSIVSWDSTGSCDMYSNTEDNSDDDHSVADVPPTLSKATLKTIEVIMRKIEVTLQHAAYVQCGGGHSSRTQGAMNAPRSSRSSQSSGKRKARGSDDSLPPDDANEDDGKRRRVSVTTTTEDSENGPRFACPFFKHDPHRYRLKRSCGGPGWPTVHRMKEHLYRCHAQPIFCHRCYAMFDSDADFSAHQRGYPCEMSAPQAIEGIDRKTCESLKKRSSPSKTRLEEDKWRDAYQLLFPEVAIDDIPSPYYDSDSPTEESRRFRRELLERVRKELFATAERESGPVEQRMLRQVADIVRRCESDLLESFYAPTGIQPAPLPSSRRSSARTTNPVGSGSTNLEDLQDPSFAVAGVATLPTHIREPQAEPGVPRDVNEAGFGYLFSPIDWSNLEFSLCPGLDVQGMEREDSLMGPGVPVWTQ